MGKTYGHFYAFFLCRVSLAVSGLWFDTNLSEAKNFLMTTIFTFNIFTIITFVNVAQTAKLIMIWGDFEEMTQIICTADFSVAMVVIKTFIYRSYKTALVRLMAIARQDWLHAHSASELQTMEANSRTAHRFYIVCLALSSCTVNSLLLLRIGEELDIFPGPTVGRTSFFNAYFPYNATRSPAYEFTWFMQYLGAYMASNVFNGPYCLFIGMMLHLCSQFRILKDKIIAIVDENNNNSRHFQKRLRIIIERHENLIKCAKVIEQIYNLIFLAELFACTVQMCVQWFNLISTVTSVQGGFPFVQILFLLVFSSHTGFVVFACCYAAERMQNESSAVFEAAYGCDWFKLPPQDAKLLMVIMHRSSVPLQMTAGKVFIFGMELYAKILKTTGGYVSLLLAVKDRLVS